VLNSGRATILACVMVGMVLASAVGGRQAGAAPDHPNIFGTKEFRASSLKKFRKWTGVIKRHEAEFPAVDRNCQITLRNRCAVVQWQTFLKKIASLPRRKQIDKVNRYFNKLLYIVDPINYGLRDYWATPKQFFQRNGDCEDYAISKYISLRTLGVPIEDMRIVVLDDLNLKIAHAVLVVYLDGEALVLDNQIGQVINAKRILHYKPIYSINERNWWLHRG
jgi:predicted transglutaminase-like cysteine proteinase